MNPYRAHLRRKLLEEIYDSLSPDDKRTFVQMTIQDKGWEEIMDALRKQNAEIEDVSRKIGKYPFASDLLANVVGNGITDGLVWLGKALFRKL